ncbi:MAG: transglutaminase-like cysteine peptidase [Hahellaceae bacterium]|nr:transglutaminase-like cysteine peptidase [Hahellaceae bacterium]MCP5170410.1 transglutaminase-like cysteine peptidase [Hahellaceae bacterium]
MGAQRQFIKQALTGCLLLCASFVFALELGTELLRYIEDNYGQEARVRIEKWQTLANSYQKETDARKLELVNLFFNQVNFVSDQTHWHQDDYWATPIELLATNGGDCEDYSIAKYFTLKHLGVSVDKLRITYVKALKLNQAHMVLAYYPAPDSEPLILDNLINDILPASLRTDLAPVYSFNGEGLWLAKIRGDSKRIGNAEKLTRWADLNSRLLKQLE